jgi:hypothetical protein
VGGVKVLTRSEQRLEWLKSQTRPLTAAESDELYRCLHAIYCREWSKDRSRRRAEALEREANAEALAKHKAETAALLERVEQENKPKPKRVETKTFAQKLKAVKEGKAKIYTLPPKRRPTIEITLGGVSSGWAA